MQQMDVQGQGTHKQVRLTPQRRRALATSAHEGAQNHRTRWVLELAIQVDYLVGQCHRHVTMVSGLIVVTCSMLRLSTSSLKIW